MDILGCWVCVGNVPWCLPLAGWGLGGLEMIVDWCLWAWRWMGFVDCVLDLDLCLWVWIDYCEFYFGLVFVDVDVDRLL